MVWHFSLCGRNKRVVSSNISTEASVYQGNASAYFSEQVKSKTFDTKLTNYEVVQSASQDDRYYAMVKMSRHAFVKDTTARLKTIDERLNSRISIARKVSKLQHYLALNEIKPDVLDATALVLLLQAASPTFDSEKYLATYRKYQTKMNELLFQMKFDIEAEPRMSAVSDIIIRLLGSEKISVSPSGAGHADVTISITGKTQNKIIFSEHATQLRVKIQVIDETGRKVNTKEYVVAGSSLTSFDASMITASNMLQQKLEDEGVLTILGLKIP